MAGDVMAALESLRPAFAPPADMLPETQAHSSFDPQAASGVQGAT